MPFWARPNEVQLLPFQCTMPMIGAPRVAPTAQTSLAATAATPWRMPLMFGLGTIRQARPQAGGVVAVVVGVGVPWAGGAGAGRCRSPGAGGAALTAVSASPPNNKANIT